jgi:hypothetical protein
MTDPFLGDMNRRRTFHFDRGTTVVAAQCSRTLSHAGIPPGGGNPCRHVESMMRPSGPRMTAIGHL